LENGILGKKPIFIIIIVVVFNSYLYRVVTPNYWPRFNVSLQDFTIEQKFDPTAHLSPDPAEDTQIRMFGVAMVNVIGFLVFFKSLQTSTMYF
jgi:hypothetical protein